jgi:hypothetical protein
MQVALQVSLTPALPLDRRRSAAQLITAARVRRASLARIYRQSSLETLAFVFQNQSLHTLRAYSAMLKSDAGQRYVRAVNIGLSLGMLDAAEVLGESMQPLVSRRLGLGV